MKKLIFLLFFSLFSSISYATPPSTCSIGSGYYDYTTSTVTLYVCTNTNIWTSVSANASIPSGLITLINSGTCPTSWTEVSALNGKMLRGTIASNGDVGTTGGNDTITPTVATLTAAAQTITGSTANESSHTHSVTAAGTNGTGTVTPNGSISIGTFVNVATATTGNCAATNVAIGTGATNACKATAPNLTVPAEGHSGSLTFTGSSSTTSSEIFTGSSVTSGAGSSHLHGVGTLANGTSSVTGTLNSFDNKPAYVNVIFCSKN